MNRKLIRRWINEYLDGEIGLADKAELERLMAENPEIRKEYTELRKIGLMLGSMPDVQPHPTRFRAKVSQAIDARERMYFTPQRAFATSMLIALIVVGLTFTMMMYQQHVLGRSDMVGSPESPAVGLSGDYRLVLNLDTSPEVFFNRLLLETHSGMVNQDLINSVIRQTSVYEGATCIQGQGLKSVRFTHPLESTMRIKVTQREAQSLLRFAEGVTGRFETPLVQGRDGMEMDFMDFLQVCPREQVKVYLSFR